MSWTSRPVGVLEHSHAQLNEIVAEIAKVVRREELVSDPQSIALLSSLAGELRDELLEHFANEEEGLFPFIRDHLQDTVDLVERLEAAHDSLCGTIVRLAHVASSERGSARDLVTLFERFESAYADHSRAEADLLDRLRRVLTFDKERELAQYLHGLA